MSRSLILAGRLDALGDSWLGTLEDWGDKGLKVALIAIVVITVVRKVSLKAGIGALIGLVLALGIYNSRNSLANIFEDEVNNPANTQPVVTVVVEEKTPGPGGVL